MNIKQIARKAGPIISQTAIILLVTILLGEISLRVFNHYRPTYIFFTDSYNRFRGKPYSDNGNFKLNSHGFKDVEFPDKRENVYRILGIGDSYAFGVVPYEHNYLTLIESQLQSGNLEVELFNMGIPSIGPQDYLSLIVREGLSFQPEMILLSFFIGNDFTESKKPKFYEKSYLLSFFNFILNIRPEYENMVILGKGEYCDGCPTLKPEQYLDVEYKRSSIYLTDDNRFNEQLEFSLYCLKQIRNICQKLDIELVVVIFPDELQINKELQTKVKDTYYPDLDQRKWDITLPNRMLSERLKSLGINHLDLYEYFADISSQALYKPMDSHLNIAGNQLAANIIQQYIQKYFKHEAE